MKNKNLEKVENYVIKNLEWVEKLGGRFVEDNEFREKARKTLQRFGYVTRKSANPMTAVKRRPTGLLRTPIEDVQKSDGYGQRKTESGEIRCSTLTIKNVHTIARRRRKLSKSRNGQRE